MATSGRVVIAGAGYAGVQVAVQLRSRLGASGELLAIDRRDSHELIVRLPEIVGGSIDIEKARIPYHRLFGDGVRHLRSDVVAIDAEGRAVETQLGRYAGDFLVVALGSAPDYHGVQGAQEHAFPVRSLNDAERLRQKIEQVVAPGRQTRVAIVGAGYTGTEVAGELAEWGRRLEVGGAGGLAISILAPEPRLLLEADPRLGATAERILRCKGVQLKLGVSVRSVNRAEVQLDSTESCPADVVVWAARAHAAPPHLPESRTAAEGRIPVDPHLRSLRYDHVYLVGDVACVYDYVHDRVVASSAQMAVQEGNLVAQNISAVLDGNREREFRPRTLGQALSLGGSDGAAEVGGAILTGQSALAVKRAALFRYLYRLGGARLAAEYM